MFTKKISAVIISILLFVSFYGCDDNSISPYEGNEVQMAFVSSYYPAGNCINSYVKNLNGIRYAFLALGNSGMDILDVSSPSSPQLIASYNVSGNTREIHVSYIGNTPYAFVAAGQGGVLVLDLSNLPNVSLAATLSFAGDYMNTVFVDDINNILFAGGDNEKVYIEDLNNLPTVTNMSIYQSFSLINKVQVENDVLYIAQDEGLDIVNVINPYVPVRYAYGTSEEYAYDVKVNWGYAFIANNSNGVLVLDVANPSNPVEASYLETDDNALACAVNGNLVYVVEDAGGIEVFDVSNHSHPYLVAYHPSRGYSVNVFFHDGYVFVSDYNNYMILRYP